MLFLWISDMWLGQREDLMEVNYFWHSWLAVCFHGKAHSPWHEHSHRQPANARPWIPHLSNVIFEISTHDSCFDSRVSNVTLRWSSELKVLPITIARTERPKIAREYDFYFFFLQKERNCPWCWSSSAGEAAHFSFRRSKMSIFRPNSSF